MTDSKENSTDDNAPKSEPENDNQAEAKSDPPAENAASGDESSDSGKGRGRSRGKRSEGESGNKDKDVADSNSQKEGDDRSSDGDSRDQGGGNNRSGGGSGRSRSRRKPKVAAKQGRDSVVQLDAKEWQGKAWELYLADIREEGTGMFDDQEARKLAKRSFDLAAIFMQTREQIAGPIGKKNKGKRDAAKADNQEESQSGDE